MKEIDHSLIIANLATMINALEFDSMRSAGKAKMNAPQVLAMMQLQEMYAKQVKSAPAKKEG